MWRSSIKLDTRKASSEAPYRATLISRCYRALSLPFQALPLILDEASPFASIGCKDFEDRQSRHGRACPGHRRRAAAKSVEYACNSAMMALLILAAGLLSGAAEAEPLRVVALGDSLSAGYMLPADAAFPFQLERRLAADGVDARVVNAGVSGDTTAGGLARLAFAMGDGADLVIVELGANDMLRGLDPKIAESNLEKILDQIKDKGASALLAGMLASANFGPAYKARFDAIFPDLAKSRGLPLYPFFLAGVSGDKALTLPDGLHPNAKGVARIVDGVAPLVEECLKRIGSAKAARAAADR
jgi:acyl-CoA thioesterase I